MLEVTDCKPHKGGLRQSYSFKYMLHDYESVRLRLIIERVNAEMNNATPSIHKAVLFWLSGMCFEDMCIFPEGRELLDQGAVVTLHAAPITGAQNHHYQVLSGRDSSCSGYFDSLVPRNYTVVEESSGPGTIPKLLPDVLRDAGWIVVYDEVQPPELVNRVQQWTQNTSSLPACLIVKTTIEDTSTLSICAEALRLVRAWVGEKGLLAVLSDAHAAPVKRFVNLNNALAAMGLLERDEQSGQVDWSHSLAYFVGHGQLWLNMQGRDARGIVHPLDEYEQVRDTLISLLPRRLVDQQTGEAVIEKVYRKEDLYAGEYLFCAPDLVVLFKPGYAPSKRSTHLAFDDAIFTTPEPGMTAIDGLHPDQITGFLLLSAPVIASGIAQRESVSLTRVCPTFLHALGMEYSSLEYSVPAISSIFYPSFLEMHPISLAMHQSELSDSDEKLIMSRLHDLGYV